MRPLHQPELIGGQPGGEGGLLKTLLVVILPSPHGGARGPSPAVHSVRCSVPQSNSRSNSCQPRGTLEGLSAAEVVAHFKTSSSWSRHSRDLENEANFAP